MTIPDLDDASIWPLLIKNYYPKLVNYLYFTTRDRSFAEDIVQEAFAVAIDKFYQLKDPNKFLPWITSITLNLARTQLKRNKRVISTDNIDSCVQFVSNNEAFIEEIDRKETQKLVQKAIAELSPQEQNMVIMRYYLDMKDKDIALALGVNQGTVKKTFFRAKAKLYHDLEHLSGNEGE